MKVCSFEDMKEAIDNNFANNPRLHAMIKAKAPRFGSGSDEPLEMANRVTAMVHDYFAGRKNYRGGPHATGWWSMANHAVTVVSRSAAFRQAGGRTVYAGIDAASQCVAKPAGQSP